MYPGNFVAYVFLDFGNTMTTKWNKYEQNRWIRFNIMQGIKGHTFHFTTILKLAVLMQT